jgi:hypothetical protein
MSAQFLDRVQNGVAADPVKGIRTLIHAMTLPRGTLGVRF